MQYRVKTIDESAVTVSGGATPTATGILNGKHLAGPISLFLLGSASTDVTVTYEIGEKKPDETSYTYVTPADGGAITDLTNSDLSGGDWIHGSMSLPVGKKFKFTITNNDAVNADTVSLKIDAEEEEV